MSPRRGKNSSSNKGSSKNNKKETKEPQPAASNAPANSSHKSPRASRHRNKQLPPEHQNNTDQVSVSFLFSPDHKQSNSPKLTPSKPLDKVKEVYSGDTSVEKNLISMSPTLSENIRASPEVGDNREIPTIEAPSSAASSMEIQTASQHLQDQNGPPDLSLETPIAPLPPMDKDKFSSSPDDPWHLTFTELRAMRTRMQTLDRLEIVTNNLARQMTSISTRTTKLESEIGHTSNQLSEVREDFVVLKKTVQASNPEQVAELREELSTLKKTVQDSKIKLTSAQLVEVQEEVSVLKQTVQRQQEIIKNLQHAKDDMTKTKEEFYKTSKKTISDMNKLVDQQKTQVDSFKSSAKNLKRDIKKDTEEQITQVKQDVTYTMLKGQAFQNRFNLIITGLPEHDTNSAYTVAVNFLKTQLKLDKIKVKSAYRIGPPPSQGNSYIRPTSVTFATIADKNAVWKKRKDIPLQLTKEDSRQTEHHPADTQQAVVTDDNSPMASDRAGNQQRIRIQADLPKQLREDVNILYKVVKAAEKIIDFKTAFIKDYALHLHGKMYTARQLERLPYAIRPSTLAIRQTNSVLAFFSKSCPLSNHYPSTFKVNDQTFYNVEQFLAFKKAELAQRDDLMQKALGTQCPVEAKAILNTLRNDNVEEWQKERHGVALKALRAKFNQNKTSRDYLCSTKDKQLGEASKNSCWGVGMALENQQITDITKWNTEGNLLGKILMTLRDELTSSSNDATP